MLKGIEQGYRFRLKHEKGKKEKQKYIKVLRGITKERVDFDLLKHAKKYEHKFFL